MENMREKFIGIRVLSTYYCRRSIDKVDFLFLFIIQAVVNQEVQ